MVEVEDLTMVEVSLFLVLQVDQVVEDLIIIIVTVLVQELQVKEIMVVMVYRHILVMKEVEAVAVVLLREGDTIMNLKVEI